jgi:hypothetical protein
VKRNDINFLFGVEKRKPMPSNRQPAAPCSRSSGSPRVKCSMTQETESAWLNEPAELDDIDIDELEMAGSAEGSEPTSRGRTRKSKVGSSEGALDDASDMVEPEISVAGAQQSSTTTVAPVAPEPVEPQAQDSSVLPSTQAEASGGEVGIDPIIINAALPASASCLSSRTVICVQKNC